MNLSALGPQHKTALVMASQNASKSAGKTAAVVKALGPHHEKAIAEAASRRTGRPMNPPPVPVDLVQVLGAPEPLRTRGARLYAGTPRDVIPRKQWPHPKVIE